MPIELRETVLMRDAEGARIARWFGDTDLGPVFHANDGTALRLGEDERADWIERGERIVARHLARWRWVPFETMAIALVLIAALTLARGLLAVPGPLAVLPALLWPPLCQLAYRRRLADLRREIGERLYFRGEVPRKLALAGLRHNLFAAIATILTVAVVVLGYVGVVRGDERFEIGLMAILVPIAWLFHFAGRRVDRVHRRRPEPLRRVV